MNQLSSMIHGERLDMLSKLFFFFLTLIFFLFPNFLNADNHIKTIAFAQDTMANDYRKAQVFAVRDALKGNPDVKFVYSDAKGRTSRLIYDIERFIKAKVAVLIVGTNDANAVVTVIEKAYENGIGVIILDRGVNTKTYTTFINSDNLKMGKMGAEFIAKKLAYEGKVLLFEGLPNADVTQLRNEGFLSEMAKYKDIEVIKRTGNYLRRDAIRVMEQLLKESVKVDAIFSESDSMLSGVRSAMKHHKKDPASVIMIGCDYTNEARAAIRAGEQTASIKFPLGGKEAAKIALAILEEKKIPKHISIPVKLVTKENVEAISPVF